MANYTLKLEPSHDSYLGIVKCFNEGRPLTPEQINYLRRFHAKISNTSFDRIVNYYGILRDKNVHLDRNQFTRPSLSQLKKQILTYLDEEGEEVNIRLTRRQFFQFRALLTNELIFFHGNQLLTGAPYFPGGVPHVDFMQWGNLFGIVKYEELLGEIATDANILIAFEEMADRNIEQCINHYNAKPKPILMPTLQIKPIAPRLENETLIKEVEGYSLKMSGPSPTPFIRAR